MLKRKSISHIYTQTHIHRYINAAHLFLLTLSVYPKASLVWVFWLTLLLHFGLLAYQDISFLDTYHTKRFDPIVWRYIRICSCYVPIFWHFMMRSSAGCFHMEIQHKIKNCKGIRVCERACVYLVLLPFSVVSLISKLIKTEIHWHSSFMRVFQYGNSI